jgi:hypothetical protein
MVQLVEELGAVMVARDNSFFHKGLGKYAVLYTIYLHSGEEFQWVDSDEGCRERNVEQLNDAVRFTFPKADGTTGMTVGTRDYYNKVAEIVNNRKK